MILLIKQKQAIGNSKNKLKKSDYERKQKNCVLL